MSPVVSSSRPVFFTPAEEGGDAPTYTPIFTWSAAGGTIGNVITGWVDVEESRITYRAANGSGTVPNLGPFGGATVARQDLQAADNFYGGVIIDSLDGQSIGNGDDMWVRIYHYFPTDFCFECGTVSGDRWGNVKWVRLEFANGGRLTMQMGALGGDAFPDSPTCGTSVGWGGFTSEYGGDQNKITSHATQVTRGTWLALQFHVHFSTSAAVGYVESWINDTYMGIAEDEVGGEDTYLTMPVGGEVLSFIDFGNYWNGGPGVDQPFFIDEIVITTETPNTLIGGRPAIATTTKVSDF